jgi:error-prone DNA polymerase
MRVRPVVTNDVLFHEPGRRILQDVVTCIRHNVTIDELGDRRERHADRYLKPPDAMQRLFARYPEALARTVEIVERCRFSLDELAYQYPEERADPSLTPQQTLEKLTWEGAAWRYPEGLPDDVAQTLWHELRLIEKLDYAPYFLTVHSIVRFARSKDILCQGRGSAANSAVCYVLGITSTFCSSASCRRSAASRPTSTSISNTSGARSSCSGSSSKTAATTRRCALRSSAIAPRVPSATSARHSA